MRIKMQQLEPEAILGRRFNRRMNRIEYKVQSLGYPAEEATWIESGNLTQAQKQMVTEYDRLAESARRGPQSARSEQPESLPAATETPTIAKRRGRPPKNKPKFSVSGTLQSPISLDHSRTPLQRGSPDLQEPLDEPSAEPSPEEAKRKRGRPKKHRPEEHREIEEQRESEGKPKSLTVRSILDIVEKEPPTDREPAESESSFCVLDISPDGDSWKFMVMQGTKKKWMDRQTVVDHHPLALIDFYENHLVLDSEHSKQHPAEEPEEDVEEEVVEKSEEEYRKSDDSDEEQGKRRTRRRK